MKILCFSQIRMKKINLLGIQIILNKHLIHQKILVIIQLIFKNLLKIYLKYLIIIIMNLLQNNN